MQAETTSYFVVWWVLFEYSRFDHFPKTLHLLKQTSSHDSALLDFECAQDTRLTNLAWERCGGVRLYLEKIAC